MLNPEHILDHLALKLSNTDFLRGSLLFTDASESNEATCSVKLPGGEHYHVKLVVNNERLASTNSLVDWLYKREERVPPPYLSCGRLRLEHVLFYTYVRPYYLESAEHPGPQHLPLILEKLRPLHRALKAYPASDDYRTAFLGVQQHLKEIFETCLHGTHADLARMIPKEHAQWVTDNREWFAHHYSDYNIDFLYNDEAQCLHGDLHPRNILVDTRGDLLFIDFDESYKSFAAPLYDLVYLFSRIAEPNGINATEFAELVHKHYGRKYAPDLILEWGEWIFKRTILMVIYNIVHRNKIRPIAEFEKFKNRIAK